MNTLSRGVGVQRICGVSGQRFLFVFVLSSWLPLPPSPVSVAENNSRFILNPLRVAGPDSISLIILQGSF